MDHTDYDTEQSLRSHDSAAAASPTLAMNTSLSSPLKLPASAASDGGKRAEEPSPFLTLTTRRRLIRKPLPSVPKAADQRARRVTSDKKESYDDRLETWHAPAVTKSDNAMTGLKDAGGNGTSYTSHDEQKAEKIDTEGETRSLPHSAIFARERAASLQTNPLTLEAARQKTDELEDLERDLLQWWPTSDEQTAKDQMDDKASSMELSEEATALLLQIIDYSLHQSLALGGAQRTGVADAILDAVRASITSIMDPQSLRSLQQTASILWRVDAIVRSNEQLQGSKGGFTALLGAIGVRWPRLTPWRGSGFRDSGSSATTPMFSPSAASVEDETEFPFQRSQSSGTSSPVFGTEQRRKKRDVAMQLLSSSLWMSGLGPGDATPVDLETPPRAPRKKSNPVATKPNRPSGTAGVPKLLSRAAEPTVALTNSIDAIDAQVEGKGEDERTTGTNTDDGESEHTNDSLPTDKSTALTDRLAKQLKSDAIRATSERVKASPAAPTTSLSQRGSRSASISSLAKDQSQLAARVVVCRVCVSFDQEKAAQIGSEERDADRDHTPQATRRGAVMNATETTSSERTMTRPEDLSADETHHRVVWRPSVFQGQTLRLNPFSSDIEGRDLEESREGVQLTGGTFFCIGFDEDRHESISQIIELAFYVACVVALEQSFLHNFDALSAAQVEKGEPDQHVPAGARSLQGAFEQEGVDTESPSLPSESSGRGRRWSNNWWMMLASQGSALSDKKTDSIEKQSRKASVSTTKSDPAESSKIAQAGDVSRPVAVKRRFGAGAHVMPYAKWGKNLITSVYKRPSTHEGRSEVNECANDHLEAAAPPPAPSTHCIAEVSAAQESTDGTSRVGRPLPIRPRRISPYRDDLSASGKGALLDDLIEGQHITLLILEGLDVALPFARSMNAEAKLASDQERWTPDAFRSKHSTPSGLSSAFSSISSRSMTASQLLRAHDDVNELLESENNEQRRDIVFYRRYGRGKDLTLGQAVEELAAKALVESGEHSSNFKASKDKARLPCVDTPGSSTFRIAQYLQDRCKVVVCATIMDSEDYKDDKTSPSSSKEVQKPKNGEAHDAAIRGAAQNLAKEIQSQDKAESGHNALIRLQSNDEGLRPTMRDAISSSQDIELWQADLRSDKQSYMANMSNAAYLFSFGAFIEAIVSHPILNSSAALRNSEEKEASKKRSHLVRMFKVGKVLLKFHVLPVEIYELYIDGPVVSLLSKPPPLKIEYHEGSSNVSRTFLDQEDTRLDIQRFFSSVKSHLTKVEQLITRHEPDIDRETNGADLGAQLIRTSSSSSSLDSESQSSTLGRMAKEGKQGAVPMQLLTRLQASLRKVEFDLYDLLKSTSERRLNDVRHIFYQRAKATKARISAWVQKHMSKHEISELGSMENEEPFYFRKGNYAFPGSSFVIRQDEPLSIIAYSLSSRDFDQELARAQKTAEVLDWRSRVANGEEAKGYTSGSKGQVSRKSMLDPDADEDFGLPRPLKVDMKRKKHNKDAGLLSLRIRSGHYPFIDDEKVASSDIVESKPSSRIDQSEDNDATPVQSRIVSHPERDVNSSTTSTHNDTFKAHVASFAPQDGLREMFAQPLEGSHPRLVTESSGMAESKASSDGRCGTHSVDSDLTETTKKTSDTIYDAASSEKMPADYLQRDVLAQSQRPNRPRLPHTSMPTSPHVKHILRAGDIKISCVSWFAEDFAKLRKEWKIDQDYLVSLSRSKAWASAGGKSKSGFHITRDGKWIAKQLLNVWTVDEKEAFLDFAPAYLRYMMNSCSNDCPTMLVKIAGVYSIKVKNTKTGEVKVRQSVQILENVFAGDDGRTLRFDLKGIRERRVPAMPAKGDGKQRNDGEGLKSSVWWDGEWIENVQPRAFVPESSKMVFRRALQNDLAFLTASNVMDYSLLVGMHEPDSENEAAKDKTSWFRARIVDFLGAWTLVKQLESSGKKAIKSHTPTIIPPHDYAARFRTNVETYFTGCPEVAKDNESH